MCPDDRVLIDNGLASFDASTSSGGVDLLDTGMSGLEAVETLAEEWAQAVVCLHSVDEEGISTGLGLVKDVQEGGSGWLLLVSHIRVPRHRARSVGKELVYCVVARTAVHKVDLGEPCGRAGGGMDVMPAEVAAVLERLFDGEIGKVLATEGHDLALGDKPSEFVLAGVGERRELDPLHLSSDGWGEMGDGAALRQKVREGGVCILAVLVVLKGLEWGVLLLWVPCWEIVGILDESAKRQQFEDSWGGPHLRGLEPILSCLLSLHVELVCRELLVHTLVDGILGHDHLGAGRGCFDSGRGHFGLLLED